MFFLGFEIVADSVDCNLQLGQVGQIYDAEMVGLTPIKACARRDQHLLLTQKLKGKLLVVLNVVIIAVDLGEYLERRVGTDGRNAGDLRERLVDKLTLLVNSAAGSQQFVG